MNNNEKKKDLKKIFSIIKKKYNVKWDDIKSIAVPHPIIYRISNCEIFINETNICINGSGYAAPIALYLSFLIYHFNSDRIVDIIYEKNSINDDEITIINNFNGGVIIIKFNDEWDAKDAFVMFYLVDSYHDDEYYLNLEIKRWTA